MRDPTVSFYQPFQSGDSICYPAFPQNYYKTETTPMFGGKKSKSKKGGAVSYANGMDCKNMNAKELDLKSNFGPFLYPPTEMPMNPQDGGKKKGRKQRGGKNLVGAEYANQPLVPSTPSVPADYVGDAYLSSPQQKVALTGSGVAQKPNPLTEEFLSNNMAITYATQAGGKKTKKQKAGDSCMTGANSPRNVNSFADAEMDGGKKKRRGRPRKQAGGDDMDDREAQLQGAIGGNDDALGRAPASLTGGTIHYRGAPKAGATSNMSDGNVWHPEWSYGDASGGRKKKLRGGNTIPTPDAEFGNAPAADELQLGETSAAHVLKAPKSTGPLDVVPGNPGSSQAVMAQMAADTVVSEEMGGGAKAKKGRSRSKSPARKSTRAKSPAKKTTAKKTTRSKSPAKKTATKKTTRSKSPAKKTTRSKSPAKKSSRSKSPAKKKASRQKGGVSDFATTLASRGPSNYPDQISKDLFRYFNKTGTFIPNSQLKFAAAPILTGAEPDPNPYPVAYNEYVGGAKKAKKAKTAKKEKKSKK